MRILIYLTDLVFGIAELLLTLRLLLKLLGANPFTPFVAWIYQTTAPLLAPFAGIFPSSALEGRFLLEFTTLFAILVYAIISMLLTHLFSMMEVETTTEVRTKRVR